MVTEISFQKGAGDKTPGKGGGRKQQSVCSFAEITLRVR